MSKLPTRYFPVYSPPATKLFGFGCSTPCETYIHKFYDQYGIEICRRRTASAKVCLACGSLTATKRVGMRSQRQSASGYVDEARISVLPGTVSMVLDRWSLPNSERMRRTLSKDGP